MIHNAQPYFARIKMGTKVRVLPIAAWREDGTPLACYENNLVPVHVIPGFQKIIVMTLKYGAPTTWDESAPYGAAQPSVDGFTSNTW